MPSHRSHQESVYVEPERHDELSDGVAVPKQVEARHERTPDGKLAKGAKTIPSMGGKALKNSTRLSHRIDNNGLGELRKRARFFRKAACTELARDVGGGHCGVIASALVKLGAQCLALSEKALAEGRIDDHRKLGEACRMHLVYAREHVAKVAEAREKVSSNGSDPMTGVRAQLPRGDRR